ncbi:MAG: hypothetical protein ACQEP1_06200 [Nanobdellota archaeon]
MMLNEELERVILKQQEDPMAIMIESRAISESFRKYFWVLWEQSQ